MPPLSAFDDKPIGRLSRQHNQRSRSGLPAITSQAPTPLLAAEHHDEEPVRKKVVFSNKSRMKLALHLSDYTPEEIKATWFSKTDFENIKADIRVTLSMPHAGTLDEDTNSIGHCCHGLECRTKEATRKRMLNKARTRNAVLDEQARQWGSFEVDSEAIAKVFIAARTAQVDEDGCWEQQAPVDLIFIRRIAS
jgi:hypothetical protein